VDLHQQFDTLELNSYDFQREVLDALAGNSALIETYQTKYKQYKEVVKELEQLKAEQAASAKELDYHQFLFDELDNANFILNELEEIESSLKVMNHAENIKSTLSEIYFQLNESEHPLVDQLKSILLKLQSLKNIYSETEPLYERLLSVDIELRDIAEEIDIINSKVNYDSEKITELNDRMALGYSLLKKHQVTTTEQLIDIKKDLEIQLNRVTNLSDSIEEKEKQSQQYHQEALKLAEELSSKRIKTITPFETKVNQLLAQVGMPNAQIKIELRTNEALNSFGNNFLEFLFNANKTPNFEPLRKVASGGELSRIMLIIKSLVAKSVQLPTLIFDEIDSGISGEAAKQVGIILKELSKEHQLISITHQPQIAAKANTHFFVFKEIKNDNIVTSIKTLNEEERIVAIATMLSGTKPTAAAFQNAKEMISN
jgi:DNA repair protein RecN (Recombination protein N)